MKFSRASSRSEAFTLIELLVVIAIIALLMGILFPAVSGAIRTAQRNDARADAVQIASAITIFWNDYSRLPDPGSGSTDVLLSEAESKQVIQILIGENNAENPREKVYLDMDTSANDGTFLDPWGNQYRIKLDRDLNRKVQYGEGSLTFGVRAVVVSAGPEGDIDDLSDNVANVDFETDE